MLDTQRYIREIERSANVGFVGASCSLDPHLRIKKDKTSHSELCQVIRKLHQDHHSQNPSIIIMVNWTGPAAHLYTLALLEQIQQIDYQAIADKVGEGCTRGAAQKHVQRLRGQQAVTPNNSPSKAGGNSPKKRKVEEVEEVEVVVVDD